MEEEGVIFLPLTRESGETVRFHSFHTNVGNGGGGRNRQDDVGSICGRVELNEPLPINSTRGCCFGVVRFAERRPHFGIALMEENCELPFLIDRPRTLFRLNETTETVLCITNNTMNHRIVEICSIHCNGNCVDGELHVNPIRWAVSGNRKRDGVIVLLRLIEIHIRNVLGTEPNTDIICIIVLRDHHPWFSVT